MMAAPGITYDAYGTHDATRVTARTAFAGQSREADTGWYLLGQRPYSPTLRRFLAPDTLSPFASGGINRYAYCSGDPINRIDPTGHSPWLFGIFTVLRREARRTGDVESASTTSGGIDASMITPGTLTSGVAGMVDTVSVSAAIVPTSMTSAPPKARGLFGRVGNEAVSEGSALPPAKRRKSWDEFIDENDNNLIRNRPNRLVAPGIDLLRGSYIPSSRIGAQAFGRPKVLARWPDVTHPTNPGSRLLASDAVTYALQYDWLLNRVQELGVKSFTHYTGSHGSIVGENWDAVSQKNLAPDRAMFDRDKTYMEHAAVKFGMAINVVDIGGWTSEQFRAAISRDGVHTLAACFGMVDSVVRREFKLPTVTIYDLSDRPGT
jgi:RHS repeat-associated protein